MSGHEGTVVDGVDESVLTLVGRSLRGVHMERELDAVAARGRAVRRRRRAVPALAVGTAAAVGLAVALPGKGAGADVKHATPATARQSVNVDYAGWSVHTNADSSVVTVTVRELSDPGRMHDVLAEAGVRASVVVAPSTGCALPPDIHTLPQIASVLGGSPFVHRVAGASLVIIHPAAMPTGSVLSIRYYRLVEQPSAANGHEEEAGSIAVSLLSGYPPAC